jgi:septal ring factor EnvC (AmiA/AmiB activator)
MKLTHVIKHFTIASSFLVAVALMNGCGGLSDTQLNDLKNLRADVNSLQSQANSLKDQRSALEKDIAEKNAKLEECNKEKQETKANLDKLPK